MAHIKKTPTRVSFLYGVRTGAILLAPPGCSRCTPRHRAGMSPPGRWPARRRTGTASQRGVPRPRVRHRGKASARGQLRGVGAEKLFVKARKGGAEPVQNEGPAAIGQQGFGTAAHPAVLPACKDQCPPCDVAHAMTSQCRVFVVRWFLWLLFGTTCYII